MSDRPVFIYAATYGNTDEAWEDYEILLAAHAERLVGTYDVAVINKDEGGKVHVHKHEKPTQHGAWGGIAVGALVGVLFTPAVLVRRRWAALSVASADTSKRASPAATPRNLGSCWKKAKRRWS